MPSSAWTDYAHVGERARSVVVECPRGIRAIAGALDLDRKTVRWCLRQTTTAPHADWIKSMHEKMALPEHRAHYRLRQQTGKPVFGIVTQAMGFRQFLLRGLETVAGEWALVTLAYHCRRAQHLRLT